MPLTRIPISYTNRLYRPYLGMSTSMRHFTDDNLVEHCADNHLTYVASSKLNSSLLNLVQSVKTSVVAKEYAAQIRYSSSLGPLKNPTPLITPVPSLSLSRQSFISKANLVFASPRINRILYQHPILFKYFF